MSNVKFKTSKTGTVHALRFSWKTACGKEIWDVSVVEESEDAITCPSCQKSLMSADSARIHYFDIRGYGIMITHIGHRATWNGGTYTSQALDIVTAGHVLDMFHMGGVDSGGDISKYFLICIVGAHNSSRYFVLAEADGYEHAYYLAWSMVEGIESAPEALAAINEEQQ